MSKAHLGILGGGQLARMLALKAHELGITTAILSEHPGDPAAQVTNLWQQGRTDSPTDLKRFLSSVDLATFESEFLDAKLLAKLSRESKVGLYPRPQHMLRLQDRLTQKRLFLKHGLPTARFFPVNRFAQAEQALQNFPKGMVLKKRRFGYDGNGTFIIRTRPELENVRSEIQTNAWGFIAEELIPFERELAIMVARSRLGEAVALPYVETFQEDARCLWVRGPLKTSTGLAQLQKKLLTFLAKTGYVGTMGIELFDSGGEVLLNEIAPRVHNSGHYTLNALSEDQFTIHLKAVLGLAFSQVKILDGGFAMYNLIGSRTGEAKWQLPAGVALHWYGKSENRPGRKMGHLNATAATPEKALQKLQLARLKFKL